LIAYFDSSALVKMLVSEEESAATLALASSVEQVATVAISRAEVAAALAQAARVGRLGRAAALGAHRRFLRDRPDLIEVPVDAALIARAEQLVWDHELRAYDAVQLAAALSLQAALQGKVVLASFDRRLLQAGARAGLEVWPTRLLPTSPPPSR